jgi:hypothetical protein
MAHGALRITRRPRGKNSAFRARAAGLDKTSRANHDLIRVLFDASARRDACATGSRPSIVNECGIAPTAL